MTCGICGGKGSYTAPFYHSDPLSMPVNSLDWCQCADGDRARREAVERHEALLRKAREDDEYRWSRT